MDSKHPSATTKETLLPPRPSTSLNLAHRLGLVVVYSPDRTAIGRSTYLRPGEHADIGRSEDVKLLVDDGYLSLNHATVECIHDSAGGQRWVVTDHNSRNGTFVNGRRCVKELLARGDVLRVGATVCVFEAVDTISNPDLGMIGLSAGIAEVRDQVERIAKTCKNALIFGETGSGKELVARAIHTMSDRRLGPFVATNSAAIADSLIESTLFGHTPHAFSGAGSAKRDGLFQQAHGGTLFFDEIDKSTSKFQSALLRVLDDKVVRRVGGHQAEPLNVRIIAAANRDLLSLVDAGEFLPDVYYRLNEAHVDAPPLRSRRADIPQLFEHFLAKEFPGGWQTIVDHESGAAWCIADLLERLCCYDWPGNVRELRNETTNVVNAIQSNFERRFSPLVPPPEACLSRPVVTFRRTKDNSEPIEMDVDRMRYYQQVYSDPALLRAAIDTEAKGNVKKFAEISAPYMGKSWDGARRWIYRILNDVDAIK